MNIYTFLAIGAGLAIILFVSIEAVISPSILNTSGYVAEADPFEELSGGETSVGDTGINSFGRSPMNMAGGEGANSARWLEFREGKGIFDRDWSHMPGGRSALGPGFSARSCKACHAKDGRGRPPLDAGESPASIVFQLSSAKGDAKGAMPHPHYGAQLDYHGTGATLPEGTVEISHEEIYGSFADGESYTLQRPFYHFKNLTRGPLNGDNALFSPRVAPANFGLGLLEAIPEQSILALADPDDADNNGISGRPNYVLDVKTGKKTIGRFGWKANQPTVEQQILKAFFTDMGVTSSLFPGDGKAARHAGNNFSTAELEQGELAQILLYTKLLAVPKRRNWKKPDVLHGKAIFHAVGCAGCHSPSFTTGKSDEFPELSGQVIRPYTDLLLHDMGEELADNRPDGLATGSEWRTPPLWGIGLVKKVNRHTRFLHDGRARNLEEAILWHGGEAKRARDLYRRLSKADRSAVLEFLESL